MSTYSKVLASLSVAAAILIAGTAVRVTAVAPPAALEGVWRTVQVVVQGPAPQTFTPGATLAIFHGRHYSRVEVHAEGPRPMLKDPAAMTNGATSSYTYQRNGDTLKLMQVRTPSGPSVPVTITLVRVE